MNDINKLKKQITTTRERQILMGAAQVFAEKGYHKATTKLIAKQAQVAEGTIYNYFKNKRELLFGLIRMIELESLQPVLKEADQLPPREFLTQLLHNRYQLLEERGDLMAPIIAEVFNDSELRQAVYQEFQQPLVGTLEGYFRRQMELGQMRTDIEPMLLTRTVMGAMMFNSVIRCNQLDPRDEAVPLATMIDTIVDIVVSGTT